MQDREVIFKVPWPVTFTAGIFIIVHGVRGLLSQNTDLWLVLALAFIPARYSVSEYAIPGGDISAITSLITYMFVHGDVVHLLMNTIWMVAFGSAVAKRIGNRGFFAFSAVCGIAGILTHLALHWGEINPVVGASAAISGQMAGAMRFVFGAYKGGGIAQIHKDVRSVPLINISDAVKNPRILLFLAIWIGINALFGMGGFSFGIDASIAWEAHIGGFIAGLLLFQEFDKGNPTIPGAI